jgi:subtilisin family serine protease
MKLSSTAIFLLLSLSSLSSVSATPNEDKKKKKKKGKSKGNDKKPPPSDDDDVELVVRYKNEQGINGLRVEANDGTVENVVSKKYKVATLKTKRSKMAEIANRDDIEAVAESQTYHPLPYTRGGHAQDERNLVDQVPYGIGLVQADQLVQGPNEVIVCVVDTGYGLGHPDLPNITHGIKGYSPYGTNERWDVDGNSHGTHCAGTIGAIGSNDIGVTSINPDPDKVTFFIGKGLTDGGSGSTAGVIAAVDECVTAGAKIISMSLGCDGNCFTAVEEAVLKDAYDEGVLIVAAAGNGGDDTLGYPASYATVMSVGAVDSGNNVASFSQHNSQVEISAPGVRIRSTITTDGGTKFSYASYSGTSMATPHVAGVAALVWSHFPLCSNNQIRNVLIKTSMDRGSTGCDEYYGHGIVQAKAAYDLLNTQGCTAGGIDPGVLSKGATGGCEQYPDSLPPSTSSPTKSPTSSPTKSPTSPPTKSPTSPPTKSPTSPTKPPTSAPVTSPTDAPTKLPTSVPVTSPTDAPTKAPTSAPVTSPTDVSSSLLCQNFAVVSGAAVTLGAAAIIDGGAVEAVGATTLGAGASTEASQLDAGKAADLAASVLAARTEYMTDERAISIGVGDLGVQTFYPGTYRSENGITTAAGTVVTLDGMNQPNPKFLFISAITLTIGADISFILKNGAKAENVVWAVGGAAALGTNVIFEGSIIAGGAITLGAGSELHGCALAQGAVGVGAGGSVTLYQAPSGLGDLLP